jgi:hypothetical protein
MCHRFRPAIFRPVIFTTPFRCFTMVTEAMFRKVVEVPFTLHGLDLETITLWATPGEPNPCSIFALRKASALVSAVT